MRGAQDAPYYRPGLYICIGLLGLSILLVACLTAAYRTLNRQADRGERILENEDVSYCLPLCLSLVLAEHTVGRANFHLISVTPTRGGKSLRLGLDAAVDLGGTAGL